MLLSNPHSSLSVVFPFLSLDSGGIVLLLPSILLCGEGRGGEEDGFDLYNPGKAVSSLQSRLNTEGVGDE